MEMTLKEIIAEMRTESLLNRVRRFMESHAATLEQANLQRKIPGILEIRNMQFQAAQNLIDMVKKDILDEQKKTKATEPASPTNTE